MKSDLENLGHGTSLADLLARGHHDLVGFGRVGGAAKKNLKNM